MLNFPSSPSVGQSYTLATRTWIYNGVGWRLFENNGQVSFAFVLIDALILTGTETLPHPTTNDFSLVNYI